MSVRDELRNEAARLNIKGRSKMTKDELLSAIQDTPGNWVVVNKRGDVSVQEPSATDGIVDADDLVTVEFPTTETVEIVDPTPRPAQGNRAETLAWIEEEVAAGRMPFPYGLRGRGIGTKTYQLVSDRTLNRQITKNLARLEGHKASAPAPLPTSERVQKYARFNNLAGVISGQKPKLTPTQLRRTLKKANKNGHGSVFILSPSATVDSTTASVLARTPSGLRIAHRFAR